MGKICDPPSFTGGQCAVSYKIRGYLRRNSIAFGNQTFGWFDNISECPVPLSRLFSSLNINNGFGGTAFVLNAGSGGRMAFYNRLGVEQFSAGDISGGLISPMTFTLISLTRQDRKLDNCGDPPSTNCRCSDDSCRVDCAAAPDGFCCIDNSFTDRLLQQLKN